MKSIVKQKNFFKTFILLSVFLFLLITCSDVENSTTTTTENHITGKTSTTNEPITTTTEDGSISNGSTTTTTNENGGSTTTTEETRPTATTSTTEGNGANTTTTTEGTTTTTNPTTTTTTTDTGTIIFNGIKISYKNRNDLTNDGTTLTVKGEVCLPNNEDGTPQQITLRDLRKIYVDGGKIKGDVIVNRSYDTDYMDFDMNFSDFKSMFEQWGFKGDGSNFFVKISDYGGNMEIKTDKEIKSDFLIKLFKSYMDNQKESYLGNIRHAEGGGLIIHKGNSTNWTEIESDTISSSLASFCYSTGFAFFENYTIDGEITTKTAIHGKNIKFISTNLSGLSYTGEGGMAEFDVAPAYAVGEGWFKINGTHLDYYSHVGGNTILETTDLSIDDFLKKITGGNLALYEKNPSKLQNMYPDRPSRENGFNTQVIFSLGHGQMNMTNENKAFGYYSNNLNDTPVMYELNLDEANPINEAFYDKIADGEIEMNMKYNDIKSAGHVFDDNLSE